MFLAIIILCFSTGYTYLSLLFLIYISFHRYWSISHRLAHVFCLPPYAYGAKKPLKRLTLNFGPTAPLETKASRPLVDLWDRKSTPEDFRCEMDETWNLRWFSWWPGFASPSSMFPKELFRRDILAESTICHLSLRNCCFYPFPRNRRIYGDSAFISDCR